MQYVKIYWSSIMQDTFENTRIFYEIPDNEKFNIVVKLKIKTQKIKLKHLTLQEKYAIIKTQ